MKQRLRDHGVVAGIVVLGLTLLAVGFLLLRFAMELPK